MGFSVRPEHLGGYAEMLVSISEPFDDARSYLSDHTGGDGLDGLLGSQIKDDVDRASQELWDFTEQLTLGFDETGHGLRRAAWAYFGDDEANADKFDPIGGSGLEPLPGSVSYPVDHYPALPVPESALSSPEEVANEVDGLLDLINELADLADFPDPLGALLDAVLCDWRVLDRAGIALENFGHRLDHVNEDIEQGLGKLLGHWKGAAADAFEEHVNRTVAAIGDLAAIGRLLGQLYQITAELLEMFAKALVKKINKAVQHFVGDKWYHVLFNTLRRAIPILGWIMAADEAYTLCKTILKLINETEAFITETLGKLQGKGITKAIDFLGGIDEGKGKKAAAARELYHSIETLAKDGSEVMERGEDVVQMAEDAERLTTPDDIKNAPSGDYKTNYEAPDTKAERRRPS